MLVRSPVSLWGNFLFVSLASTHDNMCYLMPVMEDSQAAKYAHSQLHTCEREHLHVRVYMDGSACWKPAGWSRNRGHPPLFHQPYPWPLQVLRNHVMVRVGGGWDTLGHYLDKHDPCRCTSLCESLESPLPMLWAGGWKGKVGLISRGKGGGRGWRKEDTIESTMWYPLSPRRKAEEL